MMSGKQKKEFQKIVEASGIQFGNEKAQIVQVRMSDELVNEKMTQIQKWKDLWGGVARLQIMESDCFYFIYIIVHFLQQQQKVSHPIQDFMMKKRERIC